MPDDRSAWTYRTVRERFRATWRPKPRFTDFGSEPQPDRGRPVSGTIRFGWACWGATPVEAGVVVVSEPLRVLWSFVDSRAWAGPFRVARWGRQLFVSEPAGTALGVKVTFGRPIASPVERLPAPIRLETGPVTGTGRDPDCPGCDVVDRRRRTAEGVGRGFGLSEVARATCCFRTSPMGAPRLRCICPCRSGGSQRKSDPGPGSEAAAQALVSVFRMIDPPPVDGSRAPPRRVLAAETVAAGNGAFSLGGSGRSG